LGRQDAPQLVIINLDPNAGETLRKVGGLPRQFGAVSFFVMSQTMDANVLMEAMSLGVKEFIPLPIPEAKFAAAVERVATAHGMGKKARVISFVPTIGGCGSTTVACNVAAILAKTSKTVLLDLDLMRGGAANYFDIRPRYTIADVMETADKVDKQLLDNALTVHTSSGLSILARPDLPEDTARVNQPGLQRLIGLLSRIFDNVVIDSMMSIAPLYNTVLQASDVNVIVMQLNVPSAKNAERFVGSLRRMGCEASKIKLVANRYVKKGYDIEPEEVERALGLSLAWKIPNDFKNAIGAINFGEPVVLRSPKSEMGLSLLALAASLTGKEGLAKAA
jgi:pilus assembly protein CpaE